MSLYYVYFVVASIRCVTTHPSAASEPLSKQSPKPNHPEVRKSVVPKNYRFIYPEFLPDPKVEWRNVAKEKLERIDMVNRR